MKTHPKYDEKRVQAFVCDIVSDDLAASVPDGSIDVAILIFVLSAIPPEKHKIVMEKIHRALRPGGILFFRDYGVYDMAHLRFFARKNPNKVGDLFYRRGDGTFAYFFDKGARPLYSSLYKFW